MEVAEAMEGDRKIFEGIRAGSLAELTPAEVDILTGEQALALAHTQQVKEYIEYIQLVIKTHVQCGWCKRDDVSSPAMAEVELAQHVLTCDHNPLVAIAKRAGALVDGARTTLADDNANGLDNPEATEVIRQWGETVDAWRGYGR
jgi:hypothetical protein